MQRYSMTLATPEVLSWNRRNTSTSIGISASQLPVTTRLIGLIC